MFSILQLLPFLNVGALPTILSILIYVGLSLGIFTMAKKCGLEHPAYAWIPILRLFTLGQLADACNAKEGKATKLGRLYPILCIIADGVLLLLTLASFILAAAYIAAFVIGYILIAVGVITPVFVALAIAGYLLILISSFAVSTLGSTLSALSSLISLAAYGLQVWVLYPVYKQCDEKNTVLFTVLSVLFNFAPSIILPCLAHKYESDTENGFDAYLTQ